MVNEENARAVLVSESTGHFPIESKGKNSVTLGGLGPNPINLQLGAGKADSAELDTKWLMLLSSYSECMCLVSLITFYSIRKIR